MFAMIEHEVIFTFWHYFTDEKEKKKSERQRERKVHAQISIAKKTAKKNDGSSFTYIYNAMVLRR
jgi:hypothetical protein